jgi:hypothetical protein
MKKIFLTKFFIKKNLSIKKIPKEILSNKAFAYIKNKANKKKIIRVKFTRDRQNINPVLTKNYRVYT